MEFQRIPRRNKKVFLSEQCKEIEESNRMGNTRDLFKTIRDTKGTFHAKMGLIKDRNGMDLTEAEDIENRWQQYTEELYKKGLHDQDNCNGMITHLEPDILEGEVKWALESITTNKARCSAFFTVQLSHPYMTTGKTIVLTRQTLVGKVMSLLLNILSMMVITFLPRSKHLLISWLQSPSAVILEPPKK